MLEPKWCWSSEAIGCLKAYLCSIWFLSRHIVWFLCILVGIVFMDHGSVIFFLKIQMLSVEFINIHWFFVADSDMHCVITILVLHSYSDIDNLCLSMHESCHAFTAVLVLLPVPTFWRNNSTHDLEALYYSSGLRHRELFVITFSLFLGRFLFFREAEC